MTRILTEITVVGADRKGIVASITNYIFENQGNIEKISQNVIQGFFGMHLEASFDRKKLDEQNIKNGLKELGKNLRMEVKVHFEEPTRLKNMAVLVTKEPRCLEAILEARKRNKIKVNIPLVIGTENSLKNLSAKEGIPFFNVCQKEQSQAEEKLIKLLEQFDVDFIVLARYMRILTPNFVWRYPNRIINVHPSLLPAFTGAYAYHQAYERGAQIVGCTAHFVTEDLDQGPIIYQNSFRVLPSQSLKSIKERGGVQEAQTLVQAIKFYLENKLEVYWGKVHFKK